MPIIKYIEGDLIEIAKEGWVDAIAHGCNCQNVMGAGVAKQIKEHFPEAYEKDTEFHQKNLVQLGKVSYAYHKVVPLLICNMYTQDKYGTNKQQVDYNALRSCFYSLNFKMKATFDRPILAIPRIGAGLGGGDWEIIEALIDIETPDINVIVVDYNG